MRKELAEYSDFALHSFAAAHGKAFAKFLLPAERVRDAAKCRFLARLLPELKASLIARSPIHLIPNHTRDPSLASLASQLSHTAARAVDRYALLKRFFAGNSKSSFCTGVLY